MILFTYTLIRKSFGNGVRTHVIPKRKIFSTGQLRRGPNLGCYIPQDFEPNTLWTELFKPPDLRRRFRVWRPVPYGHSSEFENFSLLKWERSRQCPVLSEKIVTWAAPYSWWMLSFSAWTVTLIVMLQSVAPSPMSSCPSRVRPSAWSAWAPSCPSWHRWCWSLCQRFSSFWTSLGSRGNLVLLQSFPSSSSSSQSSCSSSSLSSSSSSSVPLRSPYVLTWKTTCKTHMIVSSPPSPPPPPSSPFFSCNPPLFLLLLTMDCFYVRFLPYAPKGDRDYKGHQNAVVFLVSCYQYVTLAITFSAGAPFRKSLFTNCESVCQRFQHRQLCKVFTLMQHTQLRVCVCVCVHTLTYTCAHTQSQTSLCAHMHIEGSQPECCISTIYYAWETPFWSGTLNMQSRTYIHTQQTYIAHTHTHTKEYCVGLLVDMVSVWACVGCSKSKLVCALYYMAFPL